jgi:hypothetical protein
VRLTARTFIEGNPCRASARERARRQRRRATASTCSERIMVVLRSPKYAGPPKTGSPIADS